MNTAAQISPRRRTLILINIIISCVGTTLLMTALNTALVSIKAEFNISDSTGQWLVSGYSLTMGIIMPLTAFLTRRFRTKRLYMSGLAIVAVGLLIGLLSRGFPTLMLGRVLQACGDGILLSMSQVVILTIYPQEKRGMAMGWYGLAVGAAPVIAPTLGGVLVDLISWRAIFALVLIIVIVALITATQVFADVLETAKHKFDTLSFIISIFAFGGITLGVGNLANYGILHISTWLPLLVGIVAGIVFVYRELHVENAFLNVRVFKSKEYCISVASVILIYLILMGVSILMPQYVQSVLGYSATISGLVILPGALANAIVSPFAGRLYDKFGMRKLYIPGAILVVIGNVIMAFITLDTPVWVSSICYVIRSIAFGFLLMPLITWGTSFVEKKAVADATALLSSLRTIGGAIGSAVFVGIMTMAANAVGTGDAAAGIQGIRVAFIGTTIVSLVLVVLSFFVRDKKPQAAEK